MQFGGLERDQRLSYKFQRLRERVREAIRTGELSGKLPGERELARRFHANAKTVNKALTDLAAEGLLVRHVGRGTFVADDAVDASPTRPRRVGLVTTTSATLRPGAALSPAHVREFAAQLGHRVVVHTVDGPNGVLPERAMPSGLLRELDGLILLGVRPSRECLADLLRRHVPFVLINAEHETVRANCVLPDFARGGFTLCEYLISLGHRGIALLVDRGLHPAAAVVEVGYRASMRRHGLTPDTVRTVLPSEVAGTVARLDAACTALVCVGADVARAAHASAGGPPSAARSLAVMAAPGSRLPTELGLTSYETDETTLVHWAFELLGRVAPGRRPQMAVVPGRFVERGSCHPPADAAPPASPRDAVV
jgi:DNA-binding LacI/PurR family transcriptional regulator